MGKGAELAVAIVTSLISLAALALILSPQAKTTSVIGAASGGLAGLIATAVSPVTGSNAGANVFSSAGGTGGFDFTSLFSGSSMGTMFS